MCNTSDARAVYTSVLLNVLLTAGLAPAVRVFYPGSGPDCVGLLLGGVMSSRVCKSNP